MMMAILWDWSAYIFIACILSTHSVPLNQPPIVEILDGSTLTIEVRYCSFTAFDDFDRIIVSINSRCFCLDSSTFSNATFTSSNPSSITKPLVSSRDDTDDLWCGIPGPTLLVRNGITFDLILVNNLIGSAYDTSVSYPYELRDWPDVIVSYQYVMFILFPFIVISYGATD